MYQLVKDIISYVKVYNKLCLTFFRFVNLKTNSSFFFFNFFTCNLPITKIKINKYEKIL